MIVLVLKKVGITGEDNTIAIMLKCHQTSRHLRKFGISKDVLGFLQRLHSLQADFPIYGI